ncbi:hypothetical protein GDO86_014805 [Hymenochirus boettgeri]|uniref:Uncharacterized protein n=1 Tax=Hymenochirus boettgeri TaxID=247094 RepID=A0A8T2JVD6_9PIPI|nr:hypothetical protein GDO86_014805 [Hymenochirus boettgeri]
MSNKQYKHYHHEEFDPVSHCQTYAGSDRTFNGEVIEDIMQNIYKAFSSGDVKGDTIIDVSHGLFFFQLFIATDYFKDIIMIESSDRCIEEIQKWIKKEPGAIDKSNLAAFACALKGKSTGWKEQEDKLRNAIKQVVKWDISQENPLGSVTLPQADCLISVVYLEGVCKDHNMFLKILKHFSSLLKTGGHLILVATINMLYYTIGQHRFSVLKFDEAFIQKALKDTGFIIKIFDQIPRNFDSTLTDFDHLVCIVSYKEREI